MPKANLYTSIDFVFGECASLLRHTTLMADQYGFGIWIFHSLHANWSSQGDAWRERERSITLSSARTCTFLDLLITTPAPLLLLTRRWPRMEENAKLHDDACDTGVEMAEVVATPATTFIVAMVAAAAISSNGRKNLYKQQQTLQQ